MAKYMPFQTWNILQYKPKTGEAVYFIFSRDIFKSWKYLFSNVRENSLEVAIFAKAPS